MVRYLFAGGWLAVLMGAALIPPVVVVRLESDGRTTLGLGIIALGCGLIACGVTAVLLGFRQRAVADMPSGVRAAVAANILFLAFFGLELSDRLILGDGKLFYWCTFLLPPALALFCGLLAAQPWAWWTSCGVAALGVLWFLGFLAVIPFAHLETEGVPVPWYGRVFMACVTLAFAGILAGAFWSLGRLETRNYFDLIRTEVSPTTRPLYGSAPLAADSSLTSSSKRPLCREADCERSDDCRSSFCVRPIFGIASMKRA